VAYDFFKIKEAYQYKQMSIKTVESHTWTSTCLTLLCIF